MPKPIRVHDRELSNLSSSRQRAALRSRVPAPRLKVDQAWIHRDDEGAEWLLLRLSSPRNNPTALCQLIRQAHPDLVAAGDLTETLDFTPPCSA
jgi:uncharacterized protein (DUF736 family)